MYIAIVAIKKGIYTYILPCTTVTNRIIRSFFFATVFFSQYSFSQRHFFHHLHGAFATDSDDDISECPGGEAGLGVSEVVIPFALENLGTFVVHTLAALFLNELRLDGGFPRVQELFAPQPQGLGVVGPNVLDAVDNESAL